MSAVITLAWSPGDGTHVASGSADNTVRIWNSGNGSTIYTYGAHNAAVNALVWSPDGVLIASASDDRTVQVWQAT